MSWGKKMKRFPLCSSAYKITSCQIKKRKRENRMIRTPWRLRIANMSFPPCERIYRRRFLKSLPGFNYCALWLTMKEVCPTFYSRKSRCNSPTIKLFILFSLAQVQRLLSTGINAMFSKGDDGKLSPKRPPSINTVFAGKLGRGNNRKEKRESWVMECV